MEHKERNPEKLVRDRDRLAEHAINDVGPRIVPSLRRMLRRRPTEDPEGVLDEAVVRLLRRGDLMDLTPEEVDRLCWAYCRVVLIEGSHAGVQRAQRGERSVPIKELERLAAARRVRLRDGAPGEDDSATARQVKLLQEALNSLSERDRAILLDIACPIDAKESGGDLAAELGMSKKDLRVERHRARLRLKEAYLRVAEEADRLGRDRDKMTGLDEADACQG